MKRILLFTALILTFYGLVGSGSTHVAFINGGIFTMSSDDQRAEALLLLDDKIVAVGSNAKIQANLPQGTRIIDLKGKTLLPGFVDAHSHFPSSGLTTLGVDLAPSPVGDTDSLASLLSHIQLATETRSDGSWIIGFNYDDSSLDVQRHPSRQELDSVSPNNPVYLWHRSGHMGVANSSALEILGISAETTHSHGGRIGRTSDGELTGLVQEKAAPPLKDLMQFTPKTKWINVLLSARDEYLAAGITTVQNGYAGPAMMRLLKALQWFRIIPQRIVVWPAHRKFESREAMLAMFDRNDSDDSSRFHAGAVKIIVDGSPQGRTAWLRRPFKTLTPGARNNGFAALDLYLLHQLVKDYHRAGRQLALHGNGSAAIDAIIDAVRQANLSFPNPDLNHILVHGQTVQADQLDSLAELGMSVSFFPSHTFYWGDWYRHRLLGEERSAFLSPLASAHDAGVRFSLHTDAPVTPIDQLQVAWSAHRRETLSGAILGPEESISVLDALRAMTIDAAWQNGLEADRGSIEVGKFADLIVLSGDPVEADDIRQLDIETVYIGGKEVYRSEDSR